MAARPGLMRRNPDFARLYSAAVISFAGDWFTWVALQGLVLSETRSPLLAGLMLATSTLPFAIVAPFAGVVADRVDRKKLIVAADVVRAAVALSFLLVRDESTIWIAFVCNALMSSLGPFFDSASSAALPNLVRREDLARANAVMGSLWGTMLAVGAGLGGLVAATLGRDAAFVLNAVSFVVSAALIWSIKGRFREREREPQHVTVVEDIRIAWRFARGEPRVLTMLVAKVFSGIAGGPIALLSTMATLVFARGDTGIGILMGARGVGALIGPLVFRRLILKGRDERIVNGVALAAGIYSIGYLFASRAPNLWVAAALVALAHVGGGANWMLGSYALQRFTPDEIRGRIFAFDYALITLTMSAAFTVAGALTRPIGPRTVTGAWALATLAVFVVWYRWARAAVGRRRAAVAAAD